MAKETDEDLRGDIDALLKALVRGGFAPRDEIWLALDDICEQGEEPAGAMLAIERDGWRDLREDASAIPSLAPQDAARIDHVERMLRVIAERAHEQITILDVAAATPLHPNYAMALFRRSVGHTISQAITRHRLDIARSLLISTDRSIAEIVFGAGFGSSSRFYEAFVGRFGESPGMFRRRICRGAKTIVDQSRA